jgi:hypothetical protein
LWYVFMLPTGFFLSTIFSVFVHSNTHLVFSLQRRRGSSMRRPYR